MYCKFTTTSAGKWILCGEHAVLRGHAAIVFPLLTKKLELSYVPGMTALTASYSGIAKNDVQLLFWSLLEHSLSLCGLKVNEVSGHFHVDCNIALGVGMGASAALSVAVARWFIAQKLVDARDEYDFAKKLEDLFHGKSSGLDIAAVAAKSGIYFQQGIVKPVAMAWQPQCYLSSCEQIGLTSHCIEKVNKLRAVNLSLANAIDIKMAKACEQALLALNTCNNSSLTLLSDAIRLAEECFIEWGLVSETLAQHINMLYKHGALAVKPTGSGGGGYVLSLWESTPPNNLNTELISAFA